MTDVLTARHTWRWRIAGLLWLGVIGWVTLRSAPEQAARVALLNVTCVVCGEAGVADIFLNILLFLPLGLVARALGLSWWRTMAIVVPLTVGIETTQGLLLVGRDASLGDVLSNSAGGIVGWLGYPALMALAWPSQIVARRGVVGLAGLTTLIWLATGIGLRPAISNNRPLVGEEMVGPAERGLFPGRVESLALNRVNMFADPPVAQNPSYADTLDLSFDLRRTGGPLPSRSVPFVRVVDSADLTQITVSGSGRDLIAEAQLQGSRWLLHTPQWLFRNGLDIPLDQRTPIRIQWLRDAVTLRMGDTPVSTQQITIGLGWIFIHPFVSKVTDSALFWTALWLAWWFGVSGWLGGALGWRAAPVAGAVQLLLLLAAAAATGTPCHADEVGVAAISYALTAILSLRRGAAGIRVTAS